MSIKVISVGTLKEKYLKQAIEEYLKRIKSYAKVEIIEVFDGKAPENLSQAKMEEIKRREGERILANITPDRFVITLEIEGKQLISKDLAKTLEDLSTYGKNIISFPLLDEL